MTTLGTHFTREVVMIAFGGACGALGRHWMVSFTHDHFGQKYALGTVVVNILGSLLIGIMYVLISERMVLHPDWRQILMVGFLGAFTTFSTFSLDTLLMWQNGQPAAAVSYVFGSVLFCLMGAGLGVTVTRSLLN